MGTAIFIWLACGVIAAMIASGKGRSGCAWSLMGLLLGPIGVIILLAAPDMSEEAALKQGDMKKCPYCAESIKAEAVKCRYCGEEVE